MDREGIMAIAKTGAKTSIPTSVKTNVKVSARTRPLMAIIAKAGLLLPLLVLFYGPGTLAESSNELRLERAELYGDRPVREPMIARHPEGDLFVAGYRRSTDPNMSPQLWRSQDGGETWLPVDVGSVADGARGNSDVDLAVGPDGTLYFVVMGYDRGAFEGVHIVIGASTDRGDSWRWHTLAQERNSDRPWVGVADDGVAHVIWNDGRGVRYAVSDDRGQSWQTRPRIHPQGGSSHLAIGPKGELAVRVVPISAAGRQVHPGVDHIAVSLDGGDSWSSQALPEPLEWSSNLGQDGKLPRWVEPLAWDQRGRLYSLWSSGREVKLAWSVDQGVTWQSTTLQVEESNAYYPYLIARGDGEVAATWFVGEGDELAVRLAYAQGSFANGATPAISLAQLFQQPAWLEVNGEVRRDTGGEYLPISWLDDGRVAVAAVAQHGNGDRIDGPDAEVRQGFVWRVYRLPVRVNGQD